MSDPAITLSALAQFHREVVVPDVERIVAASALRLRDEMHSLHDAVLSKLDRLEFEYQALKAGLARVEARLNSVEERLRGVEERLDGVEERLDGVERRLDTFEAGHRDLVASVHRLDERLSRVEKRLDELVAAHAAYASTDEVQELRQRLEGLQARVEALEKKIDH
jgi:chromosome segregation ATPase